VWLEGTNLRTSHPTHKLHPKQFGLFKILEVLSPVTYRLELPLTWHLHNAFHTTFLSPYQETAMHGTPAPKLVEGESEWEIDKILASQRHGCKRNLQYLIKWVGYPESDNTWELADNLRVLELLKEFHKAHSEAVKGIKLAPSSDFEDKAVRPPCFPILEETRPPCLRALIKVSLTSSIPTVMTSQVQCCPYLSCPLTMIQLRTKYRPKQCEKATTTLICWGLSPKPLTQSCPWPVMAIHPLKSMNSQSMKRELKDIQVHPGSGRMWVAAIRGIEPSTRVRSYNAHTSGTGCIMVSHTKWEPRALIVNNLPGSCLHARDHVWKP
jgi:hypothetical protein